MSFGSQVKNPKPETLNHRDPYGGNGGGIGLIRSLLCFRCFALDWV